MQRRDRPSCPGSFVKLLLLLTLLVSQYSLSWGDSLHFSATALGRADYKDEDFVIVIGTSQERLKIAQASRPLRAGIRTFIALDNATLADELNKQGIPYETYAFFPDRQISGPERDKPGDTRWQAAPFLAHRHYGGSYRWMLLGDDDTLWFMRGVTWLLREYDPDLPYVLSDHLGDHNPRGFFLPSPLAAVCSPCHWPRLLATHPHLQQQQQQLAARSAPIVSAQELAGWDPRELDGWGIGRLRPRRGKRVGFGAAQSHEEAAGQVGSGGGWLGRGWRWQVGKRQPRPQNSSVVGPAAGPTRQLREAEQAAKEAERAQQQQPSDAAAAAGDQPARGMPPGPIATDGSNSSGNTTSFPLVWPRKQPLQPVNMTALLQLAYYGNDPAAPIPPPGCPCQPAQGCLHRARLCRGSSGRSQELCGRSLVFKTWGFRGNRTWCRHSWPHGGAGVVLSVGLMRNVTGGPVEECARSTLLHSCDMNLAMCLMQAQGGGFMVTHPGNAVLHGAGWADPRFILFDNTVYGAAVRDPEGVLKGRVACRREDRVAALAAAAALAEESAGLEDDEDLEEGEEQEKSEEAGGGSDEEKVEGGSMGAVLGASDATAASNPILAGAAQHQRHRRALRDLPRDAVSSQQQQQQLPGGLVGGARDDDMAMCRWLVRHAVSVHMHGRSFPSPGAAAEAVGRVAASYLGAHALLSRGDG
ncbi:hypothetical protein Agub_g13004 [Astrephomene gubernaculifera]|uniref:Uncharacterized protein n=1 Tax=Astrephomene gubernaculifera TaxID=47775 RepID=A0AAD3DZ43_9CHLO|nr:hypothetical protein Agub_g13004 [Astrephomene gubernaculifera]